MTMTDTTASALGRRHPDRTTSAPAAGTAIILIDPALSTHKGSTKLSAALAAALLGRSATTAGAAVRAATSSRMPPIPRARVEDIAALIDAVGGRPILFGSSSGAALALEAAGRLGDRVSGVVAVRAAVHLRRLPAAAGTADLAARIAASVADGDRSGAAKAFFVEAIGMPAVAVARHAVLPLWREAKTLTPTLRYDFAVLDGTQHGRPLPAERWSGLCGADARPGGLQESGVLPHRGRGAGRRAARPSSTSRSRAPTTARRR